jgi:hypothetical protein
MHSILKRAADLTLTENFRIELSAMKSSLKNLSKSRLSGLISDLGCCSADGLFHTINLPSLHWLEDSIISRFSVRDFHIVSLKYVCMTWENSNARLVEIWGERWTYWDHSMKSNSKEWSIGYGSIRHNLIHWVFKNWKCGTSCSLKFEDLRRSLIDGNWESRNDTIIRTGRSGPRSAFSSFTARALCFVPTAF